MGKKKDERLTFNSSTLLLGYMLTGVGVLTEFKEASIIGIMLMLAAVTTEIIIGIITELQKYKKEGA